MLHRSLSQGVAEEVVALEGVVVGEDAADGEAEARKPASGHVEEAGGRGVGLVGQDGGVGQAGLVVDDDVQVLVAGTAALAGAVAVAAMARLDDAGQAFDAEVDHAARVPVLVAHHRRRRVERAQTVHCGPAQDADYGGTAELELTRDPPAVPAQTAQAQGTSNPFWRCLPIAESGT